ncbi:polymeric immunoglobulin receptor-like, partial [Hoplias malabaricus]|uniref:polymeric immunoglobulin receptor-like n=1 Tax=Hoplias malabaricus TaxID=27720 RepID=UPI0034628837
VSVINSRVSGQEGDSVSVQCLYRTDYKNKQKQWCRFRDWSCLTSQNSAVQISDDGRGSVSVEMSGLKKSDAGWYWFSAGEVGVTVHLTVTERPTNPAVSVINSRVSGQEGGSVSVQCLYRTDYKNKQKQWCRFRDWSCLTSQNPSVQISDDGRGAVSVEMSGLKKSDAGWYWFSAGEVGVTVHLTVTERPTTTAAVTTTSSTEKTSISSSPLTRNANLTTTYQTTAFSAVKSASSAETTPGQVYHTNDKEIWPNNNGKSKLIFILLAVGLGLLLLLCIITFKLKKLFKANQTETRESSSNSAVHTTSTAEAEDSVIYSTVTQTKNPSSAVAQEMDLIYSNLETATNNTTLSPAAGDDAVIYSSVLHK